MTQNKTPNRSRPVVTVLPPWHPSASAQPTTVGLRPLPETGPPPSSWLEAGWASESGAVGQHHPTLPWSGPDQDFSDPDFSDRDFGDREPGESGTVAGVRRLERAIELRPGPIAISTPFPPPPTSAQGAGPPNPSQWSRWLAQLIIEVVHGRRPVGQLARWADERVLATLTFRARQVRSRSIPGRSRLGEENPPGRTGPGLTSVRVQQPTESVVEATAVIRGPRTSALAFRLEACGRRWLCTAVDFGPQTPTPD